MYWFTACFLFYLVHKSNANQTGEYYKQLWNEFNAKNWKRPTRNEEFYNYNTNSCQDFGAYDFVIVGAGSAGAVVANRLSENENWNILLLEAGGDENDFTLIPGMFLKLLNSNLNWGYLTTPQSYGCFEMKNYQCEYQRGKALGGSSAINFMMHTRGNKEDFDIWEDLGNPGWSYEDVLPYFIKAENYSGINFDKNYRGREGPLYVTYAQQTFPFLKHVIEANQELGNKEIDYNANEQIGISKTQFNIKNGQRHSTNQAYLKPINNERKNLHIITKALVTKILFSNDKEAKGLNFLHNGRCNKVEVNKEVILCAGAFNSPQLLMLSGIGPKLELNKFEIPVIADLPVGKNLEDHPCLLGLRISTNYTFNYTNFDEEFDKYAEREGIFTSTKDFAVSFKKIFYKEKAKYSDVEIIYSMGDPLAPLTNNFFINLMTLHPKSKGFVTLKSPDPLDFPIINPNIFDNPYDIEALYLGIQHILWVINTKTFKQINAKIEEISIPACKHLKSKAFWYCAIRHHNMGLFHPVATCKMGNDPSHSVVNSRLQIHGFSGIRVVDASVIPTSTSGNTNAAVVMIAEKISDEIKIFYNKNNIKISSLASYFTASNSLLIITAIFFIV